MYSIFFGQVLKITLTFDVFGRGGTRESSWYVERKNYANKMKTNILACKKEQKYARKTFTNLYMKMQNSRKINPVSLHSFAYSLKLTRYVRVQTNNTFRHKFKWSL